MSDLTKLTAEKLLSYPCDWDDDGIPSIIPSHEVKVEILRRLKRLEKCEADYKRCCELNERMAHEVHDLKAALTEAARAALEETNPKPSSEIIMVTDPLYDPWMEKP